MKIHLTAFSYRGMCTPAIGSLLRACTNEDFTKHLAFLDLVDNCDIGKTRSVTLTRFLEGDEQADVCLMLDDDMSYQPSDLLRVCQQALLHDGIVTPLMAIRKKGAGIAFWPVDKSLKVLHPADSVVEVGRSGTGIMAIPRSAAEAIRKQFEVKCTAGKPDAPFWPFFTPFVEGDRYYPDDYGFCERAARAGVKVFTDCLPVVGHHGQYCYLASEAAKNNGAAEPAEG